MMLKNLNMMLNKYVIQEVNTYSPLIVADYPLT